MSFGGREMRGSSTRRRRCCQEEARKQQEQQQLLYGLQEEIDSIRATLETMREGRALANLAHEEWIQQHKKKHRMMVVVDHRMVQKRQHPLHMYTAAIKQKKKKKIVQHDKDDEIISSVLPYYVVQHQAQLCRVLHAMAVTSTLCELHQSQGQALESWMKEERDEYERNSSVTRISNLIRHINNLSDQVEATEVSYWEQIQQQEDELTQLRLRIAAAAAAEKKKKQQNNRLMDASSSSTTFVLGDSSMSFSNLDFDHDDVGSGDNKNSSASMESSSNGGANKKKFQLSFHKSVVSWFKGNGDGGPSSKTSVTDVVIDEEGEFEVDEDSSNDDDELVAAVVTSKEKEADKSRMNACTVSKIEQRQQVVPMAA